MYPCRGFSLPEALYALLLLSLSILLLSGYHQQLVKAHRLREAQRDALWAATQALAGKPVAGWQSELQRRDSLSGCQKIKVQVRGPLNRQFALEQLFCRSSEGKIP